MDSRRDFDAADGDFVTVARRFDPLAAELLRGRLAADGIPVHLADMHLARTYALGEAAMGGVRVMVPRSWVPQATRAIEAVEGGALALEEPPGADEDPGPVPPRPGLGPLALVAIALLVVGALVAGLAG